MIGVKVIMELFIIVSLHAHNFLTLEGCQGQKWSVDDFQGYSRNKECTYWSKI